MLNPVSTSVAWMRYRNTMLFVPLARRRAAAISEQGDNLRGHGAGGLRVLARHKAAISDDVGRPVRRRMVNCAEFPQASLE
jgi:hypothetical protein